MKRFLLALLILGMAASCRSGHDQLLQTIRDNEKKLFGDSLHRLNNSVAAEQVEAYKSFAGKYPADSLSPEFLFKGADLANSLGNGAEAVTLLDSLRKAYPDHARSGTGLFLQAFIYETTMRNNEKAIAKYTEFIRQYPAHQLAQAAEFSLVQLKQGLSTEEVVKMFEAKKDTAKINQ